MIFSTPVFLFLFLPVVLGGYFLLRKQYRNVWLLTASMLFYAWGEGVFLLLMLTSVLMNYVFALLIENYRHTRRSSVWLTIAVTANLSLLAFFKYANFAVDNLNRILPVFHLSPIHLPPIALPLGISFFTFQALSYVIDVYRGEVRANKQLKDVALYISLFPQLIAGPIVRYRTVAQHIRSRTVTASLFLEGIGRFVVGLSKKVIVGDQLSVIANTAFTYNPHHLPSFSGWGFIVIWGLHVYFDFSGYSDMAIGLGKMFGFRFEENFNYPYISKTIQEFWRRWHISLSTWLRDYLYIPLGGSRKGTIRTYINLFIVFTLCGLWHGASWNFILFGVFQGLFMAVERAWLEKQIQKIWKPLAHIYFFFALTISFVIFALPDVSSILAYFHALFVPSGVTALPSGLAELFTPTRIALIPVAVLFSFPIVPAADRWIQTQMSMRMHTVFRSLVVIGLFSVSLVLIAQNSYSPFLYFRF